MFAIRARLVLISWKVQADFYTRLMYVNQRSTQDNALLKLAYSCRLRFERNQTVSGIEAIGVTCRLIVIYLDEIIC